MSRDTGAQPIDRALDPLHAEKVFSDTETRVALAGHPIHAMLVAFPISLTMCTLGADVFYWWTGDVFWARVALWAIGAAFLIGLLAGVSGTVELLMVPGIRSRPPSWTHFVIAVALLTMLGANFGLRLGGYEEAVLPFGILLSALCAGFTGLTGWHGGKLVFDYRLGAGGSKS
ncbi:DUF2231 domain-containing protein [Bosea sp. R86505]|uniref:DUF2231 domain-containing protein n=1 Tax=Bosea sp. R86505 TaxID=3101710 RepID=UPI00366DBADB